MTHDVLAIANEFIELGLKDEISITQMQLQKYCYFAHGFSLALFNEALTDDEIEAWDFGPVFPRLYDALKRYGSRPISDLIQENNWASLDHVRGPVIKETFTRREVRLIETVWNDYKEFDSFQLSALTHEIGSPWAKVYKPNMKNIPVPDILIKEYFSELAA